MPSAPPKHEIDDERRSFAREPDNEEEPLGSSGGSSTGHNRRHRLPYAPTTADSQGDLAYDDQKEQPDEEDGLTDSGTRRSLTKSEQAEAEMPMLTPGQRRLGHCYFAMQLIISICNLCCFTLKLPFLVFVIRAVLEVVKAKQQAEATPTFATPYGRDEGLHHVNDPSTTPSSTGDAGGAVAAKVEVICLLLLYVGMLVIHLDVGCVLFCSSKCKGYLHLVVYYPMVGLWLFFAAFSYFVRSWPYALSHIVLVFKVLIHGTDLFNPPSTWELALLRGSLIVDAVTFLLTLTYTILAIVWRRKRLPPHCVHNWKPHYNLIRLL